MQCERKGLARCVGPPRTSFSIFRPSSREGREPQGGRILGSWIIPRRAAGLPIQNAKFGFLESEINCCHVVPVRFCGSLALSKLALPSLIQKLLRPGPCG